MKKRQYRLPINMKPINAVENGYQLMVLPNLMIVLMGKYAVVVQILVTHCKWLGCYT